MRISPGWTGGNLYGLCVIFLIMAIPHASLGLVVVHHLNLPRVSFVPDKTDTPMRAYLRTRKAELVSVRVRTYDVAAELVVHACNESAACRVNAVKAFLKVGDLDVEVDPVLA